MKRRVIQVLTFEGCPHADSARAVARAAIAGHDAPIDLEELDLLDPATPAEYRGYPSPTILVESRDVSAGAGPMDGIGCRASGAPSLDEVRLAIRRAWDPRPEERR